MAHRKKRNRGGITALLLSLFFILGCILVYLLTDAFTFLAAAGVVLFCGIPLCFSLFGRPRHRKNRTGLACTFIAMLAVISYLLIVPPQIHSGAPSRYPYQRKLISLYHDVPNWILDFREDVTGNYHFTYKPNGVRGNGYYSVSLQVLPQRAAAYAAVFEVESCYQLPLSGYTPGMYLSIPDAQGTAGTKDGLLRLQLDEGIWSASPQIPDNSVIYIMNTNLNWSEPVTGAVIIDTATGYVQFLQMGCENNE
ncbi:MAG: hypothetical protein MJ071_02110 [Oscillospiraceae bacterium]|nr:hypothetical protein [Oscillospiraceae bacterium]